MQSSIRLTAILLSALIGVVGLSFLIATVVSRAIARDSDAAEAAPVANPLAPDPYMDQLEIPPFELVNQSGEPVTEEHFRGELTVVDFFFSNCPFICPVMKTNMKEAQMRLDGTGVQFLSISVDPERDTPERLLERARTISWRDPETGETHTGADLSTWTFATGDIEQVQRIVHEGLKLRPLEEDERTIDLSDGETMQNIVHPSHFVLVGPEGKILGLYSGLQDPSVDALIERARAAAEALAAQG